MPTPTFIINDTTISISSTISSDMLYEDGLTMSYEDGVDMIYE